LPGQRVIPIRPKPDPATTAAIRSGWVDDVLFNTINPGLQPKRETRRRAFFQ
jgi:hypothetical protein